MGTLRFQPNPTAPGKAPLTPCARGPRRRGPPAIPTGAAVLRKAGTGTGDCRRGSGKARGAFPPTLQPPGAGGRHQSPIRPVPGVHVPQRALGDIPGAVPPHLPPRELMRSAGPGFTLALPPPAAAFRSHPKGRALAALRHPAARPGPRLCLRPPPGSSLCTSWKCEGGCHRSPPQRAFPPAAHGAGPPPRPALSRGALCMPRRDGLCDKELHLLARQRFGSPRARGSPCSRSCPMQTGPRQRGCPPAPRPSSPRTAPRLSQPLVCASPPPRAAVLQTPPRHQRLLALHQGLSKTCPGGDRYGGCGKRKRRGGSGPASEEQRDRLAPATRPPRCGSAGSAGPQLQKPQLLTARCCLVCSGSSGPSEHRGGPWVPGEQSQPLQPARAAFPMGRVVLL